ncbi:hypothetical protein DFA_06886 [Cavenderia fasciculata]|uniref:NADP-dependent oxidoreductase domain-containing protein n=1 Tax=Cavenderia fasciculata TaxID=261658 RepID=F4PWY2_CACFS|nr:uncharacterized protein DFA_06886 [Cavenderia fasciculata]EGG19785.1 hypothetical protein DFA_06886 [Cavenderia fasciculata]|eukprot:XP_004358131.1 hypothetical protein DFA_06886 [Cavenderia fasciculata]
MTTNKNNYLSMNNGKKIPVIGFGTWKSPKNVVGESIKQAIKAGYRHLDCAAIYKNEKEVGAALKEVFDSGLIKREELFITSKLWCTCHSKENVEKHLKITLADLGLDYLDLYLVHWPLAFEYTGECLEINPVDENGNTKLARIPMRQTWEAMEKLVDQGLVRSIGVANCNVQTIIDILSYARIRPAMNQVELNPYNTQQRLKYFCHLNGIQLTAYSPLGHGKLITDKVVCELAKKYNRSVANILCRWAIQQGFTVIPKSVNPDRIKDNFKVLDFKIDESDMSILNNLNKNLRTCDPDSIFGVPIFA